MALALAHFKRIIGSDWRYVPARTWPCPNSVPDGFLCCAGGVCVMVLFSFGFYFSHCSHSPFTFRIILFSFIPAALVLICLHRDWFSLLPFTVGHRRLIFLNVSPQALIALLGNRGPSLQIIKATMLCAWRPLIAPWPVFSAAPLNKSSILFGSRTNFFFIFTLSCFPSPPEECSWVVSGPCQRGLSLSNDLKSFILLFLHNFLFKIPLFCITYTPGKPYFLSVVC